MMHKREVCLASSSVLKKNNSKDFNAGLSVKFFSHFSLFSRKSKLLFLLIVTSYFLLFRSCPGSLEASLTRAVLDEAKSSYLSGSTFAVSMNEATDQTDDATHSASSTCT